MLTIKLLIISLCLLEFTCAFHIVSRSDLDIRCRRYKLQDAPTTSGDFNESSSPKASFEDGDAGLDSSHIGAHIKLSRRGALIALATLSPLILGDTAFAVNDIASAVQDNDASPAPNTSLPSRNPKHTAAVSMPLVAYSFYKTPSEQSPRGLALAWRAGVRHFDVATDYGNFDVIAPMLRRYWNSGKMPWRFEDEKDQLLQTLDDARKVAEEYYTSSGMKGMGKKQRRRDIFLTYKLSNGEQSTDPLSVRRTVKDLLSRLDTSYLDLVCLHSPLTDPNRRIATYKTLLELRNEGLIRAVGVCNYGLCHLQELTRSGLPLPSVNQLELSPFNMHEPVVRFCKENGVQVSCAAWSRLSSADGPVEQWAKLGDIAKAKGVTKAQVLVRWALQKGFGCAPRSGTGSKLERIAIAENSFGGVVNFKLSSEEMTLLDSLDINYKAGKLGRRDGWKDEDVTSIDWDPTEANC